MEDLECGGTIHPVERVPDRDQPERPQVLTHLGEIFRARHEGSHVFRICLGRDRLGLPGQLGFRIDADDFFEIVAKRKGDRPRSASEIQKPMRAVQTELRAKQIVQRLRIGETEAREVWCRSLEAVPIRGPRHTLNLRAPDSEPELPSR